MASLAMLLLLSSGASAAARPPTQLRVAGRVVAVSRICGGGAAITDEMMAALPLPQPLVGKALLVSAGQQISAEAKTTLITTDANGRFELRLPRGAWCIFDAGRKVEAPPRPAPPKPDEPPRPPPLPDSDGPYTDAQCLAHQRLRCDQVIQVVDKDQLDVEVAFYEACPQPYNQPCYRGPMPP